MTDREKIMNDFEHEVNKAHGEGWDFVDLSTDDAKKILVLLKEQEPVKPIVEQYALPLTNTSVRFIKKHYCGICKEEITGNNVFCHKCGRKVKWDAAD